MSDPERLTAIRQWLRFALDDLTTAKVLLASIPLTARHVCWHAQQAAEKALKAALVFENVAFPRHRDLTALRASLPDAWMVDTTAPELAALTVWAVEARYPGGWPDATREDAFSAPERARRVCESAQRGFAQRGVAAS